MPNYKGVELVVHCGVSWQAVVKQLLKFGVTGVLWDPSKSMEDAACKGVDDEDRPVERVEQDVIGCFLPDAMYGQEFASELICGLFVHEADGVCVEVAHKVAQRLESPGLDPVEAGRSDQRLERVEVHGSDGGWAQRVRSLEIVESVFDVSPGG